VRTTVRDGGMTELAATRQFAAAFCGPERTPCSSKMKSDRFATHHLTENLTRDAALKDILPFNEHIGFE